MLGEADRSTHPADTSRLPVALAATALASGFAVLYWVCRPSITAQSWDSLSFGYAAEAQGVHALWGNHPLGHVIFGIALTIARHCGYTGRALPLFQTMNSIAGGLTVAGVLLLCVVRLGTGLWTALGITLIFGSCSIVWFCAGTAEIYTLSLLLAVVSWQSLLYRAGSDACDSWWRSGICAGLALLAHQLNVLLLPSAMVLILAQRRHPRTLRRLTSFLSAAAIVSVVGYGVFGYLATSSTSFCVLVKWPRGYIGEGLNGGYLRLQSLPVAWSTATAAIIYPDAAAGLGVLRRALIAVLCTSTAGVVFLYRRLMRFHRAALAAALLECVLGSVLVTRWEPFTQKYWVFALLPWLIGVASLSTIRIEAPGEKVRSIARAPDWVAPVLGLCVFMFNLRCVVLYNMQPDSLRQRALAQWVQHSQPGDVLIPPGQLVPLLRYWENRPNTLFLFSCLWYSDANDVFATLRRTIESGLTESAAVLYAPAAMDAIRDDQLPLLRVSRDSLGRFFERYPLRPAFSYVSASGAKPAPAYQLTGLPANDGGGPHGEATRSLLTTKREMTTTLTTEPRPAASDPDVGALPASCVIGLPGTDGIQPEPTAACA
jgi:transmembrane protein TMEM260 (protein O-mannosyltransferase)